MTFTVVADNLWFPEGPVAFADGSVAVVELLRGEVTHVDAAGLKTCLGAVGGGPNGMAMGPDGRLYITNNGGLAYTIQENGLAVPTGKPADTYRSGSIDCLDFRSGLTERLYDRCGGIALSSPNDIVFDKHGGFYFTDLGKNITGTREPGGLYYGLSDGSRIERLVYPANTMFNGCGLAPDQRTLYVSETVGARLLAFPVEVPGELSGVDVTSPTFGARVLCQLPAPAKFDSHAVMASGNICVATLETGCVSVIAPDGKLLRQVRFPDEWVTNICFGGPELSIAYVTLSSTGRLVAMQWDEPGLRLNFGFEVEGVSNETA